MTEPRIASALIHLESDPLDLNSRRGFDRGKNLQAELEEQLRQFREQQEPRGW